MGKGIDLAREGAPLHAQVIDDFKDQLLIALVLQLGGEVSIPVAQVDATGGHLLEMAADGQQFHFTVRQKS